MFSVQLIEKRAELEELAVAADDESVGETPTDHQSNSDECVPKATGKPKK